MPWSIALALILIGGAAIVHADTLELLDGRSYSGQVVQRSETRLYFRVIFDNGAQIVRSFPLSAVKELVLDEVGTSVAPPAARAPAERAAASRAAARAGESVRGDVAQILREAYELMDDGDSAAALRALQRVVVRASSAELASLSAQCRAARGVGLDDLLAEARVQAAQHAGAGRSFDLRYATAFEGAALGRRLEQLQRRRLETSYDGKRMLDWLKSPREYETLQPDAARLVADARDLAAIVAARLRFDRRLGTNRAERAKLSELRDSLTRLAAHVRDLEGFTNLSRDAVDVPDPTESEARRIREEQEWADGPTSMPTTRPVDGADRPE